MPVWFRLVRLRELFTVCEGSACCADKARWAEASQAAHLVDHRPIAINREQEYTFHLPGKVLTTHDELLGFFDGLLRLHMGRPDAYVKALARAYAQAGLAPAVPA